MHGGVGLRERRQPGHSGEPVEVDLRPPRVQVEVPGRELGELREPAGQREPRDRVPREVLERGAGEVAHVEDGAVGQRVALARGALRRVAGARRARARARPRRPRRSPAGSRRSRPSTNTARRRRSCPGSTARPRCPGAGSRCGGRAPPRPRRRSRTITSASPTASRIIRRGTGLMAGSPTGTGRPGSVTVPTPGPARNSTPEPRAPCRTVARTSAPWVTSGSSPASLTTPAVAAPCSRRCTASAKAGRFPPGRSIVTGSGNVPVRRAA